MSGIAVKISELIEIGYHANSQSDYQTWVARVTSFLATAINQASANEFQKLSDGAGWGYRRESQVGYLEGLIFRQATTPNGAESSSQSDAKNKPIHLSKKIFIVHGHDVNLKESIARFIERLRLEPVILHEQPNSGRTIIEKFEAFSDVGFAVVLLTPDDVGAPSSDPQKLKPRARQNVILELGYFMGRLSRFRVCALYKHGVEIPSDYQGVMYIELDAAGAWRQKLAQELVEANYSIDLDGLLHS